MTAQDELASEIAEAERSIRRMETELERVPSIRIGTESHIAQMQALNAAKAHLSRLNARASRIVGR